MNEALIKTRGSDSELLITVWQRLRTGDIEDARVRLLWTWASSMDGASSMQAGRVALALFRRLGFSTDNPEAWQALPDPIQVFRVGQPGIAWTANRQAAIDLARSHGLAPLRRGLADKGDVLAFITARGEDEIILPDERCVRHRQVMRIGK